MLHLNEIIFNLNQRKHFVKNFERQTFTEVAISTIVPHGHGGFQPNYGRMAAQPKFNLGSSSTPATAAAERMNI